jgi:hypothetical protein
VVPGGDVYLANANVFTNTNTFQTIQSAGNLIYDLATSSNPFRYLYVGGLLCRAGFNGAFSSPGHTFNVVWDGVNANLWIDNFSLGAIITANTTNYASISNTGSAGGAMYYYTVGGIKTVTGKSALIANPGGASLYSINFPSGYFASITSYQVSVSSDSTNTLQYCSGHTYTVNDATFYLTPSSVSTNVTVSWTIVGL